MNGRRFTMTLAPETVDPDAEIVDRPGATCVILPSECFMPDGTLVANVTAQLLIRASSQAAEEVEAALHHAEWLITEDRDEVQRVSSLQGCPCCIHRADQVTAFMRDHPGVMVAMAELWWIAA